MTSNPIPVTLIGGYLGSGKTTLINHLLTQEHKQRVAVLVNDFGELAIDAALIETEKSNIVSLSGGCVCCSYGNDLSNALMDVLAMDTAPDSIVIEASGVAMPGAIASSISLMPQLRVHSIIVLANAELIQNQAKDRYVGDTIERQLSSADLLVVNKIDLVDNTTLDELHIWIAKKWAATHTVYLEQGQLPASITLDTVLSPSKVHEKNLTGATDLSSTENITDCKAPSLRSPSLTHASLFTTFKVDVSGCVDTKALATVLASEDARLLRAKGFVQDSDGSVKLLQLVGRRWNISAAPANAINAAGSGIVCISLIQTTNASDIIKLIEQRTNTK